MPRPDQRQPEKHPLEHHGIFDLDRQPHQQHRRQPAAKQRPAPPNRPAHQQPRHQHRQIIEHRRLAALALHEVQPEHIEQRRHPGAKRPGITPPPAVNHKGGCRHEQRRQQLVVQKRIAPANAAGHNRPGIEHEQPQRLAVPDIDIGQRPMQPAVGHQQVILLVKPQHRVAKTLRPRHQHRHHNPRERQPFTAPLRVRIGQ